MPEPIIVYGATDCDDTQRTRAYLLARVIQFTEVNIDHDPQADLFVRFVNDGFRSTPTLVIGSGNRKLVVTEPDDEELAKLLIESGHLAG